MEKLKNLNQEELKEINGGSMSSTQSGLGSILAIDNLLTISVETQNGDRHTKNELSIGNNIYTNIDGNAENHSN